MKQFTKNDLIDGDILILRNGSKVEYYKNSMTGFGYRNEFLNNDLTNNGCMGKSCDVMRVIRKTKTEVVFERKELLDEVEKEYLKAVIKPFIKRITGISKVSNYSKEFIMISLGEEDICLPYFKKDTMYKKLKSDKNYTLIELGLED